MENSQLPALRGKIQNSQQNKISQSGFLVKLKQILEVIFILLLSDSTTLLLRIRNSQVMLAGMTPARAF